MLILKGITRGSHISFNYNYEKPTFTNLTLYTVENIYLDIIYQGTNKEDAYKAFLECHPSFDKDSIHYYIVEEPLTYEKYQEIMNNI